MTSTFIESLAKRAYNIKREKKHRRDSACFVFSLWLLLLEMFVEHMYSHYTTSLTNLWTFHILQIRDVSVAYIAFHFLFMSIPPANTLNQVVFMIFLLGVESPYFILRNHLFSSKI